MPALEMTFDCTQEYVCAGAMFLPAKLDKKLVVELEKVPELPNPLIWQALPRYVEHAALAVLEGLVKYWPAAPLSKMVGTFWNTEPSTRTMPPESISKACPVEE